MWVESEVGHGTTFSFSLPRTQHDVVAQADPDGKVVEE
jgi:signal transduction histidine kinase